MQEGCTPQAQGDICCERGYLMSRVRQEESTSVLCHQLVLQAPPQHKILSRVNLHLRRDLKSDKEMNMQMILLQLSLAPQSKNIFCVLVLSWSWDCGRWKGTSHYCS